MITITDINDPRVQIFRSLKDGPNKLNPPLCIAEGEKVVRAAVQSGCRIHSLFAEMHYIESNREFFAANGVSDDDIMIADRSLMTNIVGFAMHQGIMCTAEPMPFVDESDITFPCLALNGLSDSENVGALVRVARAFGWRSMIIDSATVTPLMRRAVRVSMGTVFGMAIHRTEHLPTLLRQLHKQSGAEIVGAEYTPTSDSLYTKDFARRTVLVVGSEGAGISESVLAECTHVCHIPMHSSVPSLNVATATSVLCSRYAMQHGVD
jgi:tRNA G18 (ribose-2'-O)-methylase SpoU